MDYFGVANHGKNQWWRWLVVTIVAVYPFVGNAYDYLFSPSEEVVTNGVTPVVREIIYIPNTTIFESYLRYIGFLVLFIIVFIVFHRRSPFTLITVFKKFDWWRYVFCNASWGLCIIMYLSFTYVAFPENFLWNYKQEEFLYLLLLSFTIVPIVAFFKALVFRGYLLQVAGKIAKTKLNAIILVSLVYTFISGFTYEIEIMGYQMLLFYFVSAFVVGVITVLDNRLELAIGIQTANNVISTTYITSTWYGASTYALLLDEGEPHMLFLVYIPLFILILYFILLKNIYNWKNIKRTLLEPTI